MEKKKRRKPWWKVILTIIGILIGLYVLLFVTNWGFSMALRAYIGSFAPVHYDAADRIVPEYDEELGHYTITTDRDLKVMMLTDIHLGGGCWSFKKDKKTICEVISMLQIEKPDLVILCGDNTFAVPGPMFNGGGTLNNNMAAKDVIRIFEHEGVYFTTVFGNHDTEAFDYTNRARLGKTYARDSLKYSVFRSEFTDPEDDRPSVSNQVIVVKNADGSIGKLLLLMDTNDYIDGSISATMNWQYDTIHDRQTEWAKNEVLALSKKAGLPEGEVLKTMCFFHIPTGEYETAYRELTANNFADTADSEYVEGVWDELVDEGMGGRIWFGGCHRTETDPNDLDGFFETMGPDGINTLESCFCGHDHVNNGVVRYKGVLLGYGYSLDNLAYDSICEYGLQRGCTLFTLKDGGEWSYEHKNAYLDYGVETDRFYEVNLETQLYPDWVPANAS
ncbi:MAG: metallophosphoesterase [Lachnospiraceae bacterium]|nr:metallophosphoesterase [Lachnospiraceae bacterium]